ncbi:MFS transporter [Sulfuracidifex metallicus]|uniref:MFS transporter n=1 Tax=Sulfuracidifex metallicus DSM 6482 = JCM 9184 TaxID=523847 RepID=A0A6A9QYE2_SULME|nr:MFS transporter [Sulfuracidifex metallicus]MUN30032.1 MFS transporter [Sulfuracidifex metallicus DSM 6482 = JCM 9184]WOE51588.1 MFS transporter [Sulfuracidifex metallicus DSM 6482 = JCM 9184]
MKLGDVFRPLDSKKFGVFHIKSLFTTGMGVFSDGYLLSSISLVILFILSSFGISKSSSSYEFWLGVLSGTVFIGAALGAVLFGFLANRGRKTFYGVDVMLMTIGAILQAFATSPAELAIIRFIVGIGTGADYVLSPLIMAEHSNAKDRGKLIAVGFGLMWSLGAITASLEFLGMDALSIPHDLMWRIILGAGAIPAASVIYLRRKVPETTRFLLRIKGDVGKFQTVVKEITGQEVKVNDNLMDSNTFSSYFSKFGKVFVMASVLWFLFDLTGYANGLFGPTLIARSVGIVNPAIFSLVISLGFGFPGKFLGISTIDKIGRKPLQIIGSAGEGLFLLLFAVLLGRVPSLGLMALYGMHEFLGSLGPGIISTAGMLGVELAPTKVRSIVQAITVASGRSGAAIASFLFPILFISVSKEIALAFFAILMFVAAMITFMVPETKGKPLEESSREEKLTL